MRDIVKTAAPLLAICFVVAFCLALVNNMTKGVIEDRMEADAAKQRKQVMEEADSFKELEEWQGKDEPGIIKEVHAAYRGSQLVGYVFVAAPKGYGGEMTVMVGITSDLKVKRIVIGDNNETPGLGSKAGDESFLNQYSGKAAAGDIKMVKRSPEADNEIQAVSGATITSNAVNEAVNKAAETASVILSEGGSKE
jgi:electron transport complex protein RnfG